MSKSESLLTVEEKTISTEEEEFYEYCLQFLTDPEKLTPFLQGLSSYYRVLDGLPIEPEEVFSGLLQIKSLSERTRYPNILEMKKHVCCHLLSDIHPIFGAFEKWVNIEAKAFIGLKGEGRKEGVEILKAKGMIAHGISPIFLGGLPTGEEKKGWGARIKHKFSKRESNV